jgi:glycosyltransferase involved in cell wall biosynthesis
MKILRIIDTLDPAYGGPVDSLINGTYALDSLGHSTEVITLDDPSHFIPSGFPGKVIDLHPSLGKYRFNLRLEPWLEKHAKNYDSVVVEGIWQYPALAAWMASRRHPFPYYLLVHGSLDPWFNNAYPLKKIKKALYWPWGIYPALRDAKGVLFSNREEKILAEQSFKPFVVNDRYVNYGVKTPPDGIEAQIIVFQTAFPKLKGKRLVLFLSRIDPKKGCDILLDAFAMIAQKYPDVHLVMAGPDQNGLTPVLKQQAARLGIVDKVTWAGMLKGELKWGAFRSADIFVLPSHSENFGIAIVEALACRIPALITNKVNIWHDLQGDSAGFVSEDRMEDFFAIMDKWFALPKNEQERMRTNAYNCFNQRYEITAAAQRLIETISQ